MTDYNVQINKRTYTFKRPSGTSRGILTEKHAWIISVSTVDNPEIIGIGEISIIPGLSPEFKSFEQFELILDQVKLNIHGDFTDYPSIKFGVESALLDLKNGGKQIYFDNEFSTRKRKIPINGLIWMGPKEFMLEQVEDKLASGFNTIKVKVGAINFEEELEVLDYIRSKYSDERITIRVDANGAFNEDAVLKLEELSKRQIHSIEQPIKAGNWKAMARLVEVTPIPIALDEELIGINALHIKAELLDTIHPQYIILKPSLHGGISGCKEWISLAEERGIGWWMTSALESNIGLNVICQFTAEYNNSLPQGLGTGSLYVDNEPSNLTVENGYIFKK